MRRKWGAVATFVLIALVTNVLAQDSSAAKETENRENTRLQAVANSEAEQPKPETEPQEEMAKYPDPNKIPYRTKKSALVHFLSIPSKIWHLVWSPIGSTVIWVEQNRVHEKLINFFLNDERTAGFYPLASFGGNTGAGIGINVFHNNLFNDRQKINASFLYSGTENNTATVAYTDSTILGSSFYFNFLGDFFNDSDENLFISGDVTPEDLRDSSIGANDSDEEDETSYSTEQGGVQVDFGYAVNDRVGFGLTSSFKRADVDSGDGFGGERFPDNIPGSGATSLYSIGTTFSFDFRNGWPRTLSGTLFRFGFQYNRELNGDRFEYNRYTVEVQQFIPIPILAKNRRLGVRGIFEKLDRLNDKQIPFYELSMLGDAENLRGFDQNRFRGRGSLLFNIEYRYPIWDTWDAVVFVDEGQVFDDLGDIELDEFHFAIGTGIRVMSPTGFAMRFEVGVSGEAVRALFAITPNF
ncbi:BamA/TamA family outer membrane protein [candidate division KSB1 bacterium]|nr:BamA/TamA family outer membrane protein [candidate division KSB1 bacterium]